MKITSKEKADKILHWTQSREVIATPKKVFWLHILRIISETQAEQTRGGVKKCSSSQ